MKNSKAFFLLLSLTVTQILFAQRPWKEYVLPGTLMVFSGILEGTNETLLFHYKNGFKNKFPNASDMYWNPAISWKNKYKNNDPSQGPKFPGSTDVLVGFTDAYHMIKLTKIGLDIGSFSYCVNRNYKRNYRSKNPNSLFNYKTIVQDFLVLSAFRTLGFYISYEWVFKVPTNQSNGK